MVLRRGWAESRVAGIPARVPVGHRLSGFPERPRSIAVKRLLPALLVSLLFIRLGLSPAADPPKTTSAKPEETLRLLLLDLREAKGLAAGITDKNLRGRMEKVIANMEQRVAELQKQITTAPPVIV